VDIEPSVRRDQNAVAAADENGGRSRLKDRWARHLIPWSQSIQLEDWHV
jgi:hypothetical protein